MKFCALTLGGDSWACEEMDFAFFLHRTEDLADDARVFTLTAEDIALVNPNTRTCPIFRSSRDADITKGIYRRVPVLVDESKGESGNPWGVKFNRMFDMANDSHLFHTREDLEADGWTLEGNVFVKGDKRMLPLYEAKFCHQFDHRFSSLEKGARIAANQVPRSTATQKTDPFFGPKTRYWVGTAPATDASRDFAAEANWLLGFRNVTRAVDFRTLTFAAFPKYAANHKLLLAHCKSPQNLCLLNASMNSHVADYAARQKVSGISLDYFTLRQVPTPTDVDYQSQLGTLPYLSRTLELAAPSWDMAALVENVLGTPLAFATLFPAASKSAASSTPRSSTSTASNATTSTTSWKRSRSSSGRTSRSTGPTAPRTASLRSTTRWQSAW